MDGSGRTGGQFASPETADWLEKISAKVPVSTLLAFRVRSHISWSFWLTVLNSIACPF